MYGTPKYSAAIQHSSVGLAQAHANNFRNLRVI